MNQQIEKIGQLCGFSKTVIELLTTNQTKVIFYDQFGTWELIVTTPLILPINLLAELEQKIASKLNFKLKIKIETLKQVYDLATIFEYINYIRINKADTKESIFHQLTIDQLTISNNNLTITVDKELDAELFNYHLNYYQNKLQQYGFINLHLSVHINETYNDILDLKKETIKSVVKAHDIITKSQQPIIKNLNANIQQPKAKNYFCTNKADMNKPSYQTLKEITIDEPNVVIHGQIIKTDRLLTKNKKWILTFNITDYTDSFTAKMFTSSDVIPEYLENLGEGDWVSINGDIRYDDFSKEQVMMARHIVSINSPLANHQDNEKTKRVELHTHTKMSAMDGVGSVGQYFVQADKFQHSAIAFTDHLNVQSYPEIYNLNKKFPNIKAIYGVELEVINDLIKYSWNHHHHNLKDAKYVIFDLETTGLSSEFDEIIEFGAVVCDGINGERKTYDFLIKPKTSLSNFTTELTGITETMLKDKPTIEIVMPEIQALCKDAILVAHNATFDTGFLQSWAQKLNLPAFDNCVIDTLPIARALMPELKNYRLGTVSRKLEILYDEEVAHRGDYDAEVLTSVYERLLIKMSNEHNIIFDDEIQNIQTPKCYYKERPFHLIALSKNQTGLKDLFKLISISNTQQFYGSPKILRNTLSELRSNLLIGSACVNGEIFEIARNKSLDELREAIKFYDYIEVQPVSVYKHLIQRDGLTEERIQTIIINIIKMAKSLNKLVVATGDVHYADKKDKILRKVYINTKGIGGRPHPLFDYRAKNIDYPEQHYRTTTEMKAEFAFLNDNDLIEELVVTNPNLIANQIEKVFVIKDRLYTPTIINSDRMLTEVCYENAHLKYGAELPEIVSERLKKELDSIIKHGFAVIYWIAHKLVKKSLSDGYLVGSRGSVGSSFVATMANITEVNPLQPHYLCKACQYSEFQSDGKVACGYDLPPKLCPRCNKQMYGDGHDIPFETFLGFDADKVPDIDLNFSGDYQPRAHDFTKEMFGEKYVYRAGTISTVAEKTAFGYVKGYFENNPQLGKIRKAELERLAKGCEGVKRTTGQHPGGIVVIPKEYDVEDFTPVNYPADDTSSSWLTTHFDFHAIHDNVLKLDILGHVDPTALRMLQDLTHIDPKTISTYDQEVLSLFRDLSALKIEPSEINNELTGALGIPEFGTPFVRKMLLETKPQTFADLVQISGLSHGTDVYVGNAKDIIKAGKATISQVIGCRDDIMVRLLYKGLPKKQAFAIMEDVRKGRGLKPEQEELMRQHQVEDWYIESCKKIKYMFPKAHATAYVLMAWRIAWYKIHFPHEYYATYFSTRTDVFDIKSILKGAKVLAQLINDINVRSELKGFNDNKPTQKEKDLVPVYELALEMWARNIKILNIDLNLSDAHNFKVIEIDGEKYILPPFACIDGLGTAVGASIVSARAEKEIKSISDLKKRTGVTKAHLLTFEELGLLKNLEEDEQMRLEI